VRSHRHHPGRCPSRAGRHDQPLTPDAIPYARASDPGPILIDGVRDIDLMIAHKVGVEPMNTYVVADLDE
jgi:restriction endonuclease Mrr